MKRHLVSAALVALLSASAPAQARHLRTEALDVRMASGGVAHFKVEIADDDASRERGLMYRKSMGGDRGMIFDFQKPQPVWFWMKNTLIPLDMLFIDEDGKVLNIARRVKPQSLDTVPSAGPVRAVLELRGGRADELGIREGDRIRDTIFPAR